MQVLRKSFPYIFLIIATIPLFYLNVHNVHTWGDDFSQYIKEAQNIANGIPYYRSGYIFNTMNPEYGPPQYPIGFPLLLAPIVKIYGPFAFLPMMQLISFCLVCLSLVLFAYYKRYTNTIAAICLSLICVYSSGIIELKGNILSDIPCWLFIALYMALRPAAHLSAGRTWLLIGTGLMCILIRSQSLLIIIAEACCLAAAAIQHIRSKNRLTLRDVYNNLSFKVIGGILVLYFLLNISLLKVPGNSGTLSFYANLVQYRTMSFADLVGSSSNYLIDLLLRLFDYYPGKEIPKAIMRVIIPGILALSVPGFIITTRKKIRFDDWYFILVILLLITFQQRQGIRFILSILPIYLYYAYTASRLLLQPLNRQVKWILPLTATAMFFYMGREYFTWYQAPQPGSIPSANDLKAFDYIKSHVHEDDVIIFTKARALTLFTNKKVSPYAWGSGTEENKAYFDKLKAKYILLNQELNDGALSGYLHTAAHPLDSTVIADGYMLYKIR